MLAVSVAGNHHLVFNFVLSSIEGLTMRFTKVALLAIVSAWLSGPAIAADRVALVIGNGAYEKAATLKNPVNDAVDIATKLKTLNFEVFEGTDLTGAEMRALLVQFGRATAKADVAMFFYAGHGIQAGGDNYLVPVEADIAAEEDIGLTLIPVAEVLKQLGRAKGSRLLFLDACRDNPFKRQLMESMGTRAAAALRVGLGQPRAIPDTFIAYSTQPDAVASDGKGRNSPFTRALLKFIAEPGQPIHDLMFKVGREVRTATNDAQEPWSATSLRDPFFFVADGKPVADKADSEAESEPDSNEVPAAQAERQLSTDFSIVDYEVGKNHSFLGDRAFINSRRTAHCSGLNAMIYFEGREIAVKSVGEYKVPGSACVVAYLGDGSGCRKRLLRFSPGC